VDDDQTPHYYGNRQTGRCGSLSIPVSYVVYCTYQAVAFLGLATGTCSINRRLCVRSVERGFNLQGSICGGVSAPRGAKMGEDNNQEKTAIASDNSELTATTSLVDSDAVCEGIDLEGAPTVLTNVEAKEAAANSSLEPEKHVEKALVKQPTKSDKPDDDIASKAAVALAAVAAAATANNKSPAEAAREARDLAQTFISQAASSDASVTMTIDSSTGAASVHVVPGGGSGTTVTNSPPVFTTVKLSAVKTHLRQRVLETGSTVMDKLCQGDNDTFLQHLLLLEHYRCIDDAAEKEAEVENAPSAAKNTEVRSKTATEACERLEAVLRRIEGAYDSLVDMLPPEARRRITPMELDDKEDFEKAVVVPDLLPPCKSEKGDLTVAFFRACIGDVPEQQQKQQRQSAIIDDHDTSCSLNSGSGRGGETSLDQPSTTASAKALSPPPSPGKGSVFSSMFKRNTSATPLTAKGFNVFRKSKRSVQDGKSEATSSTLESTESLADSGLRSGEYIVRIEREMLGLTVENVLERTVVRTVVAGGPAKKAGAKVGSLIVKVGNVETKNLTHFETIDELRQSNRPLQLVMRQITDEALRSAREEMGRLIKGSGFGTIMDGNWFSTENSQTAEGGENQHSAVRPLIEADLRMDSYTNLVRRRFAEASPQARTKKEEALARVGEKLVWILTLFVIGLEREASHLFSLADSVPASSSGEFGSEPPVSPRRSKTSMYHHTAKDYIDAAKSISKVLFDYTRKKIDPHTAVSQKSRRAQTGVKGTKTLPPPPPLPGKGARGLRRQVLVPGTSTSDDSSVAHEKPLLQIGDVLQRTRTFLADPTSPPAALLRAEVIAFLCDVLDIDTEMELSEEEAVSSTAGPGAGAGGINDLGSAGSLLKLIVLNCPIMRSPCCEEASERIESVDSELEEEARKRFGPSRKISSVDLHRLHAGNRFLAVVHRLAASRSTSARIAACSLGPVLWGHLDFPHQLQLRGVITRALHDVEVIVRKSTATVLHEIAELVFDSRSVPWLVLMCERAMTDPEPQLRSAAMTLTWHLAEHLPNAFLGDARQGSRYLRRLPSREDPLFADVYLLQCKLLPVATRLAEDRSPSVRLAVAAQSDRLCDALGDHWSSVIIDVLLGLLSDSDERVRCEAVSCVPRLSEIVLLSASPGETAVSEISILEALLPAATKLQKDPCASVRVALATAAGELLTLLVAMERQASESLSLSNHGEHTSSDRRLDPDSGKKYKMQVDDRLIPMVQSLLNDADPEVTSASLRAVTNATRSSVQHSRPRHMSAASAEDDASLSSFHSHTSRGERPVFLPVLSENQVLRLLPTLTELSDSRQWRVRQSAVEIVPALLGCTSKLETRTEISKLCIRLMGDQVDAVRKTAAECLCMGGSSLGSHGEDAGGEWITSIVIPTIRKCAIDTLSKQRLLSLKMVEVILLNGVCPNKWYSTPVEQLTDSPTRELVTIALSLTTDRIANVRLNVGRVLEAVIHVFEEQDVAFIKEVLCEQIETEKGREGGGDIDVVYFASRCVSRAEAILEERSQEPVREAHI
jgi:PDZ domain